MPDVNINLVCVEDTRDLTEDRSTRHFYPVSLQYRVNVVGIDSIESYHAVIRATCKLPDAAQVGPVGGQLKGESLLLWLRPSVEPPTLVLSTPLSFTTVLKHCAIPGISRMMVFRQARSTMPTSSSLGKSVEN